MAKITVKNGEIVTADTTKIEFTNTPISGTTAEFTTVIAQSLYGSGSTSVSSTGINPYTDNSYDIGNISYRWNDVYATNGTIQTSDERKKEYIEEIPYGLEFANKLRPVQYKWKDYSAEEDGRVIEKTHTRKHFGLIAQELKNTLEENNINTEDFAPYVYDAETDSYAIRYVEFIPILIKSVQELSSKNKELEKRLEVLELIVSSLIPSD